MHHKNMRSGADAINISGLLVQESGLLNPKKVKKLKKLNAIKKLLVVQTLISQKFRSPDLGLTSPNFTPYTYLGVQTPKQGIPQLGVNFFIASVPDQFLYTVKIVDICLDQFHDILYTPFMGYQQYNMLLNSVITNMKGLSKFVSL